MADKTKVADVPFLLTQWDYEKNTEFDIHKMNVGSEKMVQWHCRKCNYKWPGSIVGRYNAKGSCPVCDTGKAIMPGYNDAFTRIPDLKETYDFQKNDGFDIEHQGINSEKKIWWKCKKCGREWETAIVSRKIKNADGSFGATKCPCQKTAVEGVNDIFTLVEGLKDCYDFEKNKDVNVLTLKVSSDIPLYWKCKKCGHEWVSPIFNRINRVDGGYVARGCQKCYLHGINRITSIASMPKLVKFWDFEKNTDKDVNLTSAHSNEPAHWKCRKCGYEWEASIKGRTGGSGKCPYCEENQSVLYPGKNDVLTLCYSATKYFDSLKNENIDLGQVYVGSTMEMAFKCPECGREWRAPLDSRIVKKKDGTYRFKDCSCHHSGLRTQTYAEQYPRLNSIYDKNNNQKSLDKIQSTEIRDKYHWICDICGEPYYTHFMSVIAAIKNTNTIACPYCSHTLLRKGESFADAHPELVAEYDESNTIDIYQVFPASKKEVLWKCLNDQSHKWPATFAARHIGSDKCPICYPTIVRPGMNSLRAIYKDIADMWSDRNDRTSDEILYNSSLWVYLNCPECHMEFGTFLKDFISGKTECPYCAEKRVLPGVNSLADKYPNIAQMWSPTNEKMASEIWPDKGNWALWICPECQGEYRAQVNKVVDGSADCPYCADRLVLPGLNSFQARHPDLMEEWDYVNNYAIADPDTIGEKNNTQVWWICTNNHSHHYPMSVKDKLTYQKRHREPCPYCKGRRRKKRHFV